MEEKKGIQKECKQAAAETEAEKTSLAEDELEKAAGGVIRPVSKGGYA